MSGFSTFLEEKESGTSHLNKKKVIKDQKKGLLIAFEGCDGVGKSTQVKKLEKWLEEQGYSVVATKWNSHPDLAKSIKSLKDDRIMTPMLYCLMHACDLILRYENEILPALNKNQIVVADRWTHTSMARDKARGVDVDILKEIYRDVREPDILFHCVLPIHKAFSRLVKEQGLSYYGTGMDLNLADNREDNYVQYETILDKIYKKILPDLPNYERISMEGTPDQIFDRIKSVIREKTGISKYV